jgi:hypothetical protein
MRVHELTKAAAKAAAKAATAAVVGARLLSLGIIYSDDFYLGKQFTL